MKETGKKTGQEEAMARLMEAMGVEEARRREVSEAFAAAVQSVVDAHLCILFQNVEAACDRLSVALPTKDELAHQVSSELPRGKFPNQED